MFNCKDLPSSHIVSLDNRIKVFNHVTLHQFVLCASKVVENEKLLFMKES